MRKTNLIIFIPLFIIILFLMSACENDIIGNKLNKKVVEGGGGSPLIMKDENGGWCDSFEHEDILDIFEQNGGAWTFPTVQPEGAILETRDSNSGISPLDGNYWLYCEVPVQEQGLTSKSMVAKKTFHIAQGDTITAEAWYYVSSENTDNIHVLDIEYGEIEGSPGVRVAFSYSDYWSGIPVLNTDKIGGGLIGNPEAPEIPKDQWFKLKVELKAGIGDSGRVKFWINDELVVDEIGQTIIEEIPFYNKVKIGITARLREGVWLGVDDVCIRPGPES